MKTKTVTINRWFGICGLFLLIIPFIMASPVQAAAPNWQLPALQCESGETCEIRVSPQGTLYTFYRPTLTLYISKADGSAPTGHVLTQSNYTDLGGTIDFVPYDDLQVVMLYSNTGHADLFHFDISTNVTTRITTALPDGKLTSCNRDYRLLYLPGQYISRLGMGNQLIFCSYSPQATFRVHILYVSTMSLIHTLDIGEIGGFYNKPNFAWGSMLGGLDGNIYFETNRNTGVSIFDSQVTNLAVPPDEVSLLFVYNPTGEIWSVQPRTRSQYVTDMYAPQSTGSNVSIIVNVDFLGNLYIYTSWSDLDRNPHYELLKQNPDLIPIALASDVRNGALGVFSGITVDGYVVSRTGFTLGNTLTSQINDFPLPTPTFIPTSTFTLTPTATPK